jgi:hypothetical protein
MSAEVFSQAQTKGWNTERLDKAVTDAAALLMEDGARHRAEGRISQAERYELASWCILERIRLLKNGFDAQAGTIRLLEEQLNSERRAA